MLDEPPPPGALKPEPKRAADAYFLGITHLFLNDMTGQNGVARMVLGRLLPAGCEQRSRLQDSPRDS